MRFEYTLPRPIPLHSSSNQLRPETFRINSRSATWFPNTGQQGLSEARSARKRMHNVWDREQMPEDKNWRIDDARQNGAYRLALAWERYVGGRAARLAKACILICSLFPIGRVRVYVTTHTRARTFRFREATRGGVEGRPSWNKKAKVYGKGKRRPLVDL